MNQTLSVIVQQITPPIIWNSYQRMRRRTATSPCHEFGFMATFANSKPLLEGKFAELYIKHRSLNPLIDQETYRYRIYNILLFR